MITSVPRDSALTAKACQFERHKPERRTVLGDDLTTTATVQTGGGGQHVYFQASEDVIVKNSAGKLGAGIDLRGEGGYVIAPPSSHASGNRYEWVEGSFPRPLPRALQDLLVSRSQESDMTGSRPVVPIGETIVDGQRNDTLFRYACSLRGKGGTRDNILASIKLMNAQHCSPPLSDGELQDIARSAARYPPNHGQ